MRNSHNKIRRNLRDPHTLITSNATVEKIPWLSFNGSHPTDRIQRIVFKRTHSTDCIQRIAFNGSHHHVMLCNDHIDHPTSSVSMYGFGWAWPAVACCVVRGVWVIPWAIGEGDAGADTKTARSGFSPLAIILVAIMAFLIGRLGSETYE